jgi:AcrR family transcriptional regulator
MSQHLSKTERQRQLLDAAILVFGARGYHRTQVSDIIKQADVARGTFYLYFKSKREIFDTIMTELFEQVSSQIKTLPHDATDKIPEQLMGNIERITNLLLDNPPLTKILFNESVGLDTELDERLKKFYGQILDYIRRGLRQGQEMGFVREGDHRILSMTLLGSLKEVFYQYLLGTERPEREDINREIFRFVIAAIAHPNIRSELEKLA